MSEKTRYNIFGDPIVFFGLLIGILMIMILLNL